DWCSVTGHPAEEDGALSVAGLIHRYSRAKGDNAYGENPSQRLGFHQVFVLQKFKHLFFLP
ncbi:MAG TPA: hypothetical protein DCL61_02875, partial [Cyanobacteria bacterium UBA12227]|nr:hypothetical protein [Cyanobacteria bacterium UBA12227]